MSDTSPSRDPHPSRDPRTTRPAGEHLAPLSSASGPPASGPPNAAQLRDRIDHGDTGDKVPLVDPAAAGLGTDDEAAGAPPDAAAAGTAMADETRRRPDPVKAPGLSGDRFAAHEGDQPRRVPRGLIVVGVLTILFICVVVLVEALVR